MTTSHVISNHLKYASSEESNQPAHMCRLIDLSLPARLQSLDLIVFAVSNLTRLVLFSALLVSSGKGDVISDPFAVFRLASD